MQTQVLDANPVAIAGVLPEPVAGRPGWYFAEIDDDRHAAFDECIKRSSLKIFGKPHTARDAVEPIAFAVSQLAYVEQKVFARQYALMLWQRVLAGCIDGSAGEWAETVEYEITDEVGVGAPISPSGTDVPMVDVSAARKSMRVQHGGVGYEYTLQQLRASAALQRPLPEAKQAACVTAYNRHMNKVALFGETQTNFTGIANNALVTAANRPSGAVWDAATPATILSDINAGILAVYNATAQNTHASKLLLPPASYNLLQKARSDNSDLTILKWIKENNIFTVETGQPFDIQPMSGLETAGGSSSKRGIFYNPADDNMVMHIPMSMRFAAPEVERLKVIVLSEYRYGGLEIRRPATAYYMDGL